MTLATVKRYDPESVPAIEGRAVVIGASVAGLATARVLADAFDRVTVVEKDTLPDEPVPRSAIPQGTHIHSLHEAGRAVVEDLCPGYGEDLIGAGGLLLDGATDLHFFAEGDFHADGHRHFPMYFASRPLFEHVLRERVAENDRIDIRDGCQFTGLRLDDDANVHGVAIKDRGETTLPAALVVDTTGRTSRTPTWLADHGYEAPPVDEVHIDIAYSTVTLPRPPSDRRAVLVQASPPHTRGGAMFPIEGDRWLINVHGVHGDHPPTALDAFEAFAASLPTDELANVLTTAQPIETQADYYPFPASRRYRYEALDRFPEGLLVLGDAIASFNPLYGQGMSVAALEALGLHHALAADGLDSLPLRFFERVAPVVDVAWTMAIGADSQFSQTRGPQPRGSALFARYIRQLNRAAHDDGVLSDALLRVITMERPPTSLLRPGILWRVLRSIPASWSSRPWPRDTAPDSP